MPPKVRITREMIVESGYQIADEKGIENVNCREIAKRLGCSTQPVFSRFPSMEELKQTVFTYACDQLEKKILSEQSQILRKSLVTLADLARNHKYIFSLIYLSDFCSDSTFIEERIKFETNRQIRQEIMDNYHVSQERATDVLERVSLFVHGINTVIATSGMDYPDEKIIHMVEQFLAEECGAME